METTLKFITAAIISVLALTAGVTLAGSDEPTPQPEQCQEDEACWDCETMGNLVCGTADIGTPLVIEAPAPAAPAPASPTFTG